MKVLFHVNTVNYRGTTVAVTDYAKYNQEILGNESIIVYNDSLGYEKDMGSELRVINDLKKQFNVIGYKEGDLEGVIDKEKVDFAYFLRSGEYEYLPENVRTGVHAVFQRHQPHGNVYAYISEWLSNKMTGGTTPFVPHIVSLPKPDKTYREAFNIRPDQIVVGRYGGYYTFDLPFVKKAVEQIVTRTDKFVFLFMGTEPFVTSPCVRYITETQDLQKKANFIETCDVMLHGRQRGESFGLSIAEFLSLNKPVLSWEEGHDLNHLELLKDSNLLYNQYNLLDKLSSIKDLDNQEWSKRVEQFKPEIVMKKFNEVFL